MRNTLPKRIHKIECGIVNLDNSSGEGTHWTAYFKKHDQVIYFDSYGNLQPPKELVKYFLDDGGSNVIKYNYHTYQNFNSIYCGHLCLIFLYSQCI